jgi:hypothetical protein
MATEPGSLNINIIIFAVLLFVACLFVLIPAGLVLLHKKRPQYVTLEAIKVHEFISLCISVLYFITVLVTLVLLIFQNKIISEQTRYALQSVEGSIYASITTQTLAQDEIFINNPELRPYFYAGKELDHNDPLREKVHAIAEYLLDFYDSLEGQLKKYPYLWIHEKKTWEANLIDMFAWSPELCRYLEATRDWYSDELYALKKAGERKRQQGFTQQILPKLKP